jgi:hypothetical protein
MIVGRIKRGAVATTLIPLLFGFFLHLLFSVTYILLLLFADGLRAAFFSSLLARGAAASSHFAFFLLTQFITILSLTPHTHAHTHKGAKAKVRNPGYDLPF